MGLTTLADPPSRYAQEIWYNFHSGLQQGWLTFYLVVSAVHLHLIRFNNPGTPSPQWVFAILVDLHLIRFNNLDRPSSQWVQETWWAFPSVSLLNLVDHLLSGFNKRGRLSLQWVQQPW